MGNCCSLAFMRDSASSSHNSDQAESWDHGTAGSWLDQEVANVSNKLNSASILCFACQPFFANEKEPGESHRQFRFRSSLLATVAQGCRLCAVVWNKIQLEAAGHDVPEKLELTYWLTTGLGFGCELHASFTLRRLADTDESSTRRASADFRFARPQDIKHPDEEVDSIDTASPVTQKLSFQWFQSCKVSHHKCNQRISSPKWMPTRLVCVESSGLEGRVRVVETDASFLSQKYVALSHCWGSSTILTLNTKSQASLKDGIAMQLLSQNFRDAIEIAAWFDIRYLWIDSLCILQDSLDDWKKEAVTMKDVYKNALFTIAATRASNSAVGCFTKRDPSLIKGFEIPTSRKGKAGPTLYCFDKDVWADGVSEAPLNQRAWVVQERFLSSRILHFGEQQVFWECQELTACESYPKGFPHAIRNENELNRFKDIHSTREIISNTAGLRIVTHYKQWERILDAYSRSNLTKTTDKIIALAGVAEELGSLYGDEYLAGLWRRYLPEQLMWKVSWESSWRVIDSHLTVRSPYYRAPTWTWLSVDGPIDAGSIHDNPVFIEILDAKVEHDVDRIVTGYVRIRGVLTECRTEGEGDGYVELFSVQGNQDRVATGYIDDKFAEVPDKVMCLPIIPGWYSARYDETIEVTGLILYPTGEQETEYKRLGWFSVSGKENCRLIEQGPRTTSRWNEVYVSDDNTDEELEIERQTFDDGARDNLYRHLPTTAFTVV